MKAKELQSLGIPRGGCIKAAFACLGAASRAGLDAKSIRSTIKAVVADPGAHVDHEVFGELARALLDPTMRPPEFIARTEPAPYRVWGNDIEESALDQMRRAAELPVSVRGALMPDAHMGYGLPIGGVLATEGSVIPYAVGMDIACRMKMSVFDIPVSALDDESDRLKDALVQETSFGIGAKFNPRREHSVMDDDWDVSPVTKRFKDRAWSQLGTSGSGNHFAEYGVLTVLGDGLNLAEGSYLALLSHSGSRGTGGEVAKYYSKLAQDIHLELPRELLHLAWLDLASEPGQEYWAAMELMGRYAAANHELIHRHVREALGVEALLDIENHHNFAWKEEHEDAEGRKREVVVHRKGATPAGVGMIGIIPGSMGTPGYVVRGRGEPSSLNSASHGAGRRMSRTKAKQEFNWEDAKAFLAERNVELISAGLDEVPMAYKDIDEVMAAQADLVEPVARFEPRLVKMAPDRGRRGD
jgi:tRNA-splicing ligase RtcB